MGAAAWFLFQRLSASHGNTTSVLVTILVAVLVYVVMVFLTGALRHEDMEYIPGGGRITRLMTRLRLWRQ